MNQVAVLDPRPQPLTVETFGQIEAALEKQFEVKVLTEGRSVPQYDNDGVVYGHRFEAVPVGLAIRANGEPNQKLVEAVQRPATKQAIAVHLTKLSSHKFNARGASAFQVIIEDACRDLEGCSEWAVMKAYDRLRNEPGDFFPSLRAIVEAVKWFDAGAKSMGKKETQKIPPAEQPKENKQEGKFKVASVMHKAGLPHDKEFCRECGA